MSEPRAQARPPRPERARLIAGSRVDIIRSVTTPLGFFVLVVLVVEAIIGVVAGFSSTSDRTIIVLIMAAIVVLLVATVTVLAIFIPEALGGQRVPPSLVGIGVQAPELTVVKGPKILLAATPMFTEPHMGFRNDVEAVRLLQSKSSLLTIAEDITSERIREIMIRNKFDIIHFLAAVEQSSGDVQFSDKGELSADGFAELVKITSAKLILLATCDSIALGGRLSRITNVIAASSSIAIEALCSWERCFFAILAQEYPLSQAFEISRNISDVPLVLLMKADLAFSAK